MLSLLFEPLVKNLANVGMEQWNQHQTFKNARLAIRDRLRREARLNAELLKKISSKDLIHNEISTKALQEVFEMPMPLNKILDKDLSEDVRNILESNKNYSNWTANILNEADLVERIWHRTIMLQIFIRNSKGRPNLPYLAVLNRSLAVSLSS